MLTQQEIQKSQGTRLSDTAPWMSYATEFDTKMSPELAAQVADYAEKHHKDGPVSSQTQEELCRLHEANEETAKEYKWLSKEEYDDEKARIGQPMHSDEFISRLRKAGVRCWYREHVHPDKITLLATKYSTEEPKVACWVQRGYMQELSVMDFDDYGAPLAEKRRGWRTPLLQLILQGYISESDADKTFGKPKTTQAYHRYNSLLQAFRNQGNRLSKED